MSVSDIQKPELGAAPVCSSLFPLLRFSFETFGR